MSRKMDKLTKIGSLDYQDFHTEFWIGEKTKKYVDEQGTALSSLIPDAHIWYEVLLFEQLDDDDDGIPDKKYGKNFKAVYYAVSGKPSIKGFVEVISDKIKPGNEIDVAGVVNHRELNSPRTNTKYLVKYKVFKI